MDLKYLGGKSLKVFGRKPQKIGLALGGGGARGLAHIGVLRVLERYHIPIHIIVGTSMGAAIGGVYSALKDLSLLEDIALHLSQEESIFNLEISFQKIIPKNERYVLKRFSTLIRWIYLWTKGIKDKSLVNQEGILKMLTQVLGERTFKDTKLPFACVATRLENGGSVILKEGEMVEAIMASIAIPGIFPPVRINGELMVDGGVVEEVPVEAAFWMGADKIIAVETPEEIGKRDFPTGFDIFTQADVIKSQELRRLKSAFADVLISPEVRHINWASFSKAQECIRRGEEAAQENIEAIQKLVHFRRSPLQELRESYFTHISRIKPQK